MCIRMYVYVCVYTCDRHVCVYGTLIGEYSISKLILKLVEQYITNLSLSIKMLNILVLS